MEIRLVMAVTDGKKVCIVTVPDDKEDGGLRRMQHVAFMKASASGMFEQGTGIWILNNWDKINEYSGRSRA